MKIKTIVPHHTTAYTDKVLLMVRAGKTLQEIADETHHSLAHVLSHAATCAGAGHIDQTWYQQQLDDYMNAPPKPVHKRGASPSSPVMQVAELVRQGHSAEQIGDIVGKSRTLVYYYIKRAETEGLLAGNAEVMSQKSKLKYILKRKITVQAFIDAEIADNRSFDEFVLSLGEHIGFAVSRTMTIRLLKTLGYSRAQFRRRNWETPEMRAEIKREVRKLLKMMTNRRPDGSVIGNRYPDGTRSFVAKWLFQNGYMRLRNPSQAQLVLYLFLRQRSRTPRGKKVNFSIKRSRNMIEGIKLCLALGKEHIRREVHEARKLKAAKAKQPRVEQAPEVETDTTLVAPWVATTPEASEA